MTRAGRAAVWATALLFVAAAASAGPPAALAPSSPAKERAEASFGRFARKWMDKLSHTSAGHRKSLLQRVSHRSGSQGGGSYRGVEGGFEIELRATGVATAPFVGILRYSELTYRCPSGASSSCRVTGRTPVTEIFRLKGSRWIY